MNWIDRAERQLGHLAIPNLIRIVAGLNALVFILSKLNPYFLSALTLDPAAIAHGEVWRLASYILIPSFGGPLTEVLFVVLYLSFLWWIGDGLEQTMGSFRVNLFYGLGVIGTALAACLAGANFGSSMLNSSLLFAAARFFPDAEILVMFILPVKIKWVAAFSAIYLALGFLAGPWAYKLAMLLSLGHFFLFFGGWVFRGFRTGQDTRARRPSFEKDQIPEGPAMHYCAKCGRTELVAPELEFRVAKDGNEYCSEHLGSPLP